MKNYLITVPVKTARGFQSYAVNAESEKDALRIHNAGKSEFVSEEIEVTSVGKPKVELNE